MAPRPEVTAEAVEKTAEAPGKGDGHPSLSPLLLVRRNARYQRITVRAAGEDSQVVKSFAREMILIYDRGDEVSLALGSAERLDDYSLREYRSG